MKRFQRMFTSLRGRAATALSQMARPVRKAPVACAKVLGPMKKVAAPLCRLLAPLAPLLAPFRASFAWGVRQARAVRPHLKALGAALFLGLFITLLSIHSAVAAVALMLGLTAFAVALRVLYAGIQGKSWAITVSFLLIAFTIDATARHRGNMSDSGMDGQTAVKLLLWGGGFVIGALNFTHLKRALAESVPLRWLCAFAAWSLFSTVYSITPTYTFGGGFGYLALLCFTAVTVQTVDPAKLKLAGIYACGLLTTSALLLYKVAPSLAVAQLENGTTPRLAGLTGSPNNLGRTAAIALFFIFFAVRDKEVKLWRFDIVVIALSALAALIMSWSRTSLMAVVVAIALVLVRKRLVLMLWGFIASVSTLFTMVMVNVDWDQLVRHFSRHGSLSELTTLTGRTAIWRFVWKAFLKEPLLGYGYGSTKLLIPMGFRTIFDWTTTSAHNMFLQALVTTGLVGALCVVLCVLFQLRDFVRRPNDMADAAFLFVIISGFSEAGAVGVAPNLLTIFWLLSLTLPREKPEEAPAAPLLNRHVTAPYRPSPVRGERWGSVT